MSVASMPMPLDCYYAIFSAASSPPLAYDTLSSYAPDAAIDWSRFHRQNI